MAMRRVGCLGAGVVGQGLGLVRTWGPFLPLGMWGRGQGPPQAGGLNNSFGALWPGFMETSENRAPLGDQAFLVPEGLADPCPLSCEARIPPRCQPPECAASHYSVSVELYAQVSPS